MGGGKTEDKCKGVGVGIEMEREGRCSVAYI